MTNIPVPESLSERKLANHHWLAVYDSDGHYHRSVVLQWNPGAQKWSLSGQVGSDCYINTKHFVYLCPCVQPPMQKGEVEVHGKIVPVLYGTLGDDTIECFNIKTGYSFITHYKSLVVRG